ncbi:MAG: hypothetical protein LBE01_03300 [Deltaproteobacteria bacterium]|jgi:adenine-specific DNA-methyltransferase|nr:hypothetical protein [Deltaproteobacteria bacterium]
MVFDPPPSSEKLSLEAKIKKLGELFPGCLAEARRPSGRLGLAVDFDRLRMELSAAVPESLAERYLLDWPGRKKAAFEASLPSAWTLRPSLIESQDFAEAPNLIVDGDPIEILKICQNSYLGKVKLFYASALANPWAAADPDPMVAAVADPDPMAAAAADPDSMVATPGGPKADLGPEAWGEGSPKAAESLGRAGRLSLFCSSLKLARKLLCETGAVFLEVDDHEAANLKKIGLETFGEKNFIAQFVVRKPIGQASQKGVATAHSYVLAFAKNVERFEAGLKAKEPKRRRLLGPEAGLKPKLRLLRKWGANSRREDRPNLYYPIKAPDGRDLYPLLSDGGLGCWRWGPRTMAKAIEAGKVAFVKKGDQWVAYEKCFEGSGSAMKYATWVEAGEGDLTSADWPSGFGPCPNGGDGDRGQGREAGSGAATGGGQSDSIGSPKAFNAFKASKASNALGPLAIAKLILKMANVGQGELVFDFMSQSVALAQAVLELNAEDGGSRRFILTLGPRASLKTALRPMGAGFRALKIGPPPRQAVYLRPDAIDQAVLWPLARSVKPGQGELDLLFSALLGLGLDLGLPIKREAVKLNGREYVSFVVGDGLLVASFEEEAPLEVVLSLARRGAKLAIFLDNSFATDDLKMTAREIFKRLSPMTELKTL